MTKTTTWTLKSRPNGMPTAANFEAVQAELQAPKDGEIQLQNTCMSVDPYMRPRMGEGLGYIAPFQVGKPLDGHAVGRVLESKHKDFAKGDLVVHMAGWTTHWTGKPEVVNAQKISDSFGLEDSVFIGVLGMPGMTAYIGLFSVIGLKKEDVLFVNAAAGAVGSTVVQMAKITGCKVVASAGGPEKCAFVKSLGADEVIDYKACKSYADLLAALKKAAPEGLNACFENVGGDHFQAAIECMNKNGRIAVCGMISSYNDKTGEPSPGPNNMTKVLSQELRIEGFIMLSFSHVKDEFLAKTAEWVKSGKLKYKETFMQGIEKAPEALLALFTGDNTGKMIVKL